MADDFRATAYAMSDSANALGAAGHHRNACYLAGYVVECVLKAMLLERHDRVGTTPPYYQFHEPLELHALLAHHALAGDREVVGYGLPLAVAPTICAPVGVNGRKRAISHWDPGHRYDGARWTDSADYLAEADAVIDILLRLELDGVLP